MKIKSRIIATIAVFAAGAAFAPAALAAGNQTEPAAASQRRTHQVQTRKPASAPVPQNSCDYDRAAGRCIIDLGYGRCMECNAGPMN